MDQSLDTYCHFRLEKEFFPEKSFDRDQSLARQLQRNSACPWCIYEARTAWWPLSKTLATLVAIWYNIRADFQAEQTVECPMCKHWESVQWAKPQNALSGMCSQLTLVAGWFALFSSFIHSPTVGSNAAWMIVWSKSTISDNRRVSSNLEAFSLSNRSASYKQQVYMRVAFSSIKEVCPRGPPHHLHFDSPSGHEHCGTYW